jgi:hypothetical protein
MLMTSRKPATIGEILVEELEAQFAEPAATFTCAFRSYEIKFPVDVSFEAWSRLVGSVKLSLVESVL